MKQLSLPLLLAVFAALSATPLSAADKDTPATLMTERGKLLVSDDFTGSALASEWRAAKGKWEVAEGIVRGAELKEDMHAAVIRRKVEFHDAVFQFSFRLSGAKATSLSLNDSKGHVCRVVINPSGFTVVKDKSKKDSADKPAQLDIQRVTITPETWHTMVVEVSGKRMLARLDNGPTAYGEHEGIDVDKADIGFTVGGQSTSFRNLRVWAATAKKDFDKEKIGAGKNRASE